MEFLDRLTPPQRQLLMIGVPVVAVFALVSVLQKKGTVSEPSAPTGYTMPQLAPSTDVIGTGQLAEFESMVTGAINQLAYNVGDLTASVNEPPPPPPAPAPLPKISSSAFPVVGVPDTAFEVLGTITAAGGSYTGLNVQGGAPVYAYTNGEWRQNFDAKKLAVGTPLATPSTFKDFIVGDNPGETPAGTAQL